mmetsp:Transcript_1343/g.2659  ORF Transcript_1343/g.2659 Transcript_1343/m.2659 type:complete len:93 (-) Transcript_1343:43-321(-)
MILVMVLGGSQSKNTNIIIIMVGHSSSSTTTTMANHNNNNVGIFGLGTAEHHDKYHETLGEEEPWPPVTSTQAILHEWKAENQKQNLRSNVS